ncbi:hemerythrin domain-containing protein [Aliikangiella sp. G2MR2-5]|uniref:hemerythrin domain-containing protein n=1 Tax=Aliikangiella sp. G2MR2-5 TaxID=2788943 RepID=UPI0018AB5564|nr:hemerythrin domain-containing protein [Aliikangiella sp. G2MR2-5]
MQLCDYLKKEHCLILSVIQHSKKLVSQARLMEWKTFSHQVEFVIEFIENFTDSYHHYKEEELLFSALNKPGVLTHCNPVGQMLYEHESARKAVNNIKSGLKERCIEGICSGLEEYGALLEQHIFKEDNILYPMAERSLDEVAQEKVLQAMQEVDARMERELLFEKYNAALAEFGDYENKHCQI